jgi:hypothetical protein
LAISFLLPSDTTFLVQASNVPSESSILTVVQSGERTTVGFRDWRSAHRTILSLERNPTCAGVLTELNAVVADCQPAVLAFDLAPVDFLPCSVLGLLVSLHNLGMRIELLHPSEIVREELKTTKLDQLFVVRD